ncbi:Glu/Leu/Phe/Val dehydrogenase dimerization domain-containing protein [Sphingomonas sp. HF-S4]|uniref:Glu/Leu/Phe/Val dehydrogenase dimerization domain-containing protein n=1 Tax=Sphingomonas agrestis TaxID=3080540 RepID=A0ABU3Y488_9SPHN|nr:Glu/Leu/Phe/Val dehydrogenase dimerization domain-containing protein [Sphingomonas sp. HF-S4]MDV3456037.1 Glu/Leu/Phe/Val dehydrogenase dimerization domain-containing protein [Sphingomonas sp. HF-S4]
MAFEIDRQLSPESVHVFRDEASGLDAVIALHSTALGPAAGGCRLWQYASGEDAAADACRLAEGMSYKNALAGLPLGGGKAVLRRPEGTYDRRKLFAAFGQAVRELGGRYVTAEDVGTSVADMETVRDETRHVAGLPARGAAPGGDPSPWTARGVFLAMQAAAARRLDRGLGECTVAIQGVGHVGSALAGMLHAAGAKLIVADMDAAAVARVSVATGAQTASLSGILTANADIFAPCALGGVLNHASIARLSAKVVCGAANNQLAEPEDGTRLADRGVLYAPDYVVNAGGIINVAAEYLGWSQAEAAARVEATPARLLAVLDQARARGVASNVAADQLARAAIAAGGMARRAA